MTTRTGVFAADNLTPEAEELQNDFWVGAGRFRLVRSLGVGGMGQVWLAEDSRLDRKPVALKFVSRARGQNLHFINQLRQELIRTQDLQDKNIVKVHDWHEFADEPPFISMEYVAGMSLLDILSHHEQGLPYRRLHPLFIHVCQALIHAHERGIIHRDIKPANILTDTVAGIECAKLTDFGIGRIIGDQQGGMSGTLAYMSPAQVAAEPPSPADDIFALGVTLHQLLSGELPYGVEGCNHNELVRLESLPNAHNRFAAVPIPIRKLIGACLQKDPQFRPPSVEQILLKLRAFPPSLEVPAPRPTARRPEPKPEAPATDEASENAPPPPETRREAPISPAPAQEESPAPRSNASPLPHRRTSLFVPLVWLSAGIAVLLIYLAREHPALLKRSALRLTKIVETWTKASPLVSSQFQNPDVMTNNYIVFGSGSVVDGWQVLGNDVTLIDGNAPNKNVPSLPPGEQFLELGRNGSPGTIERQVTVNTAGALGLSLAMAVNDSDLSERHSELTVTWILTNSTINRVRLSATGKLFNHRACTLNAPEAGTYLLRLENASGIPCCLDDVVLVKDKGTPALPTNTVTTSTRPSTSAPDSGQVETGAGRIGVQFTWRIGNEYLKYRYELFSASNLQRPIQSGSFRENNQSFENLAPGNYLFRVNRGESLVPLEREVDLSPNSTATLLFGGERKVQIALPSNGQGRTIQIAWRHDSWSTNRPNNSHSYQYGLGSEPSLQLPEGNCILYVTNSAKELVERPVFVRLSGDEIDDNVPLRVSFK